MFYKNKYMNESANKRYFQSKALKRASGNPLTRLGLVRGSHSALQNEVLCAKHLYAALYNKLY